MRKDFGAWTANPYRLNYQEKVWHEHEPDGRSAGSDHRVLVV
jgi:hypothetical protein